MQLLEEAMVQAYQIKSSLTLFSFLATSVEPKRCRSPQRTEAEVLRLIGER